VTRYKPALKISKVFLKKNKFTPLNPDVRPVAGDVLGLIVKPGAKKNEAILAEDGLTVFTTAPPIDNKANESVIKLIKKQLGFKVEIVAGHTSKLKRVRVCN
jgi:uncharacterized protein (TIGR00251 family)